MDGLGKTAKEVKRLNDPDVDIYIWINDLPKGGGLLGQAYTSGACDANIRRRTSLSRGPSRGVVETAEVIHFQKTFFNDHFNRNIYPQIFRPFS